MPFREGARLGLLLGLLRGGPRSWLRTSRGLVDDSLGEVASAELAFTMAVCNLSRGGICFEEEGEEGGMGLQM
jgi:hypothetical protein